LDRCLRSNRSSIASSEPNHHRHVFGIDYVASSGEEMRVYRHRCPVEAESGGYDSRMGERSRDRSQEAKSGGTIGRTGARIASTISTVEASVVIRRHGRTGQGHGNGRSQVARAGSGDLRATLGVEAEMFALGNLHAFQAGFDFLFNSIGWHYLVENNPELSVAIQPAGWADLQHRAFYVASLGKKQLV